ncbi:hypothetical protein TNCT_20581 [Trichonephila clavata]|uniref:Uncharacterized protein n=1 Tax=Trichonephila clavata TaxID=2740835 RepID=A0A8X6FXJ6_TRICU|nr:hypothetical protein TNCT_20581 [Trichonephila clavata]
MGELGEYGIIVFLPISTHFYHGEACISSKQHNLLEILIWARSTSSNVAPEQQQVLFYADHAGNMHEMTAENLMSEEITPEIPWSLDASNNIEKELETPKRSFK